MHWHGTMLVVKLNEVFMIKFCESFEVFVWLDGRMIIQTAIVEDAFKETTNLIRCLTTYGTYEAPRRILGDLHNIWMCPYNQSLLDSILWWLSGKEDYVYISSIFHKKCFAAKCQGNRYVEVSLELYLYDLCYAKLEINGKVYFNSLLTDSAVEICNKVRGLLLEYQKK